MHLDILITLHHTLGTRLLVEPADNPRDLRIKPTTLSWVYQKCAPGSLDN